MLLSFLLLPWFFLDAGGAPVKQAIPAAPVTACAAVTRTEVEQALQKVVDGGTEATEATESTCEYSGRGGMVTVSIRRLTAKLDWAAEIESLRKAIPEAAVRAVTGIGSRAIFLDIPGAGTQLHAIQGERAIMISVLGFGEAAQVSAAAEGMARKALGRL